MLNEKDSSRFWSKVEKTDTCWLWKPAKKSGGYGKFRVNGKFVPAHIIAYEEAEESPVPDGHELDHLCMIKPCVRRSHLEAVTHKVNSKRRSEAYRKTHCKRGHELSPENVYLFNGCRDCLQCRSARAQKAYLKRKDRRAA